MLANIAGYTPETIEFVLSPSALEKFPKYLFEGAENPEEVIEAINDNFVALYPENESATRKYDAYEIDEIREEYCLKQENDIPRLMAELADAIETAKRMKKDAEDRLAAAQQEIRDLAARVKDGTTSHLLSSTSTVRIALNGHFVYYSWVDGKFQLVKAEKIPEWDKRSLWSQEDKNRTAMLDLFGIQFPETEVPTDEDEEDPFGEE